MSHQKTSKTVDLDPTRLLGFDQLAEQAAAEMPGNEVVARASGRSGLAKVGGIGKTGLSKIGKTGLSKIGKSGFSKIGKSGFSKIGIAKRAR